MFLERQGAGLDVDFGTAFVTALLISVCNFVAGFVICFISGGIGAPALGQFLSLVVGFLIASGIIGARLEVGFGKGALIALVMVALGIAIALVVGVVIFAVTSAM